MWRRRQWGRHDVAHNSCRMVACETRDVTDRWRQLVGVSLQVTEGCPQRRDVHVRSNPAAFYVASRGTSGCACKCIQAKVLPANVCVCVCVCVWKLGILTGGAWPLHSKNFRQILQLHFFTLQFMTYPSLFWNSLGCNHKHWRFSEQATKNNCSHQEKTVSCLCALPEWNAIFFG